MSKKYYESHKHKIIAKYKKRYAEDEEFRIKQAEYQKKYRANPENKERAKAANQKYRKTHREKQLEACRVWRADNAEYVKKRAKEYYQQHKKYLNRQNTIRRTNLKRATPKKSRKTELYAIQKFYEACPKGLVVDHIWPLKHPLCSGLHVLANLQYIPQWANNLKYNKLPHEWEKFLQDNPAVRLRLEASYAEDDRKEVEPAGRKRRGK